MESSSTNSDADLAGLFQRNLQPPGSIFVSEAHYNHLVRLAQEYSSLREALLSGGITEETLNILINGPSQTQSDENSKPATINRSASAGEESTPLPQQPLAWRQPRNLDHVATEQHVQHFSSRSSQNAAEGQRMRVSAEHAVNFTSTDSEELPVNKPLPRSLLLANLPDSVTLKEIVDVIRGGQVVDVYVRQRERVAQVSFLANDTAKRFKEYAQQVGLCILGKRVDVRWSDRQFKLHNHIAMKIRSGATRNFVIRDAAHRVTESQLREDLEHIHHLVVIDVTYHYTDIHVALNSVHNALFARTCLLSRGEYRGLKIEWDLDPCDTPLPQLQVMACQQVRYPVRRPQPRTQNRFEILEKETAEGELRHGSDDLISLSSHEGELGN